MKFSIVVFACLMASVLSTPIEPNKLKVLLGGTQPPTTTTTTTPAPTESTTTVKSTDSPTTVPSETTTVVKDDSTTAIVEVTTTTTQQESTEVPTTVPSSTTVVPLKSKVSTEPAPAVVENTKKSPETQRKGRGSKKFNVIENPEEKPKKEEQPKEETPEKEPEQKPDVAPEDKKPEEIKPEAKEDNPEKESQQKPKEADDSENIPTVSGKIVPAVAQPRIPSPEVRSKGRKYKDIQIVQLESELEENGKYHYKYENEDGTIVHQSGEMKMMDHDGEKMMGESVEGAYSYKDDDGNTISLTYTADENGFRPVGAHIPTIPPAIARSLAWQATAKPWVDPWVVEQEKLRKARKISSKSDE